MAETIKKKKAPAKPKGTTATQPKTKTATKPAAEPVAIRTCTREEIAQLAHRYWAERGWQHGSAEQDWFRAERELRGMAS